MYRFDIFRMIFGKYQNNLEEVLLCYSNEELTIVRSSKTGGAVQVINRLMVDSIGRNKILIVEKILLYLKVLNFHLPLRLNPRFNPALN